MRLLKVDTLIEAENKLKEQFEGFDWRTLEIPLHESVGRYIAQDINSNENLPGFDRSVVDGYALRAKETVGAGESSPVFFDLTDSVEMGEIWQGELEEGYATYVATGGMVPRGADGVVMIEHTEKLDDHVIAIHTPVAPLEGVMSFDEDISKGQNLYKKGHRIRPVDVGVLAAIGTAVIFVFDEPVVSVVSTGDEIVSIIENPIPGKVRDVNSFALASLVQETGCRIGGVYLIEDDAAKLEAILKEALTHSDLVLMSGGSSQGHKDHSQQVIDSLGKPGVITHGLALKPGKPTILGIIEDTHCTCCNRKTLVAGLPGHPVAAIGVYHLLIEPFIKRTFFKCEEKPVQIKGALMENLAAGEGRETLITVRLEKTKKVYSVYPIHGKSGAISQLLSGDRYLVIPSGQEGLLEGSVVDVTLFK